MVIQKASHQDNGFYNGVLGGRLLDEWLQECDKERREELELLESEWARRGEKDASQAGPMPIVVPGKMPGIGTVAGALRDALPKMGALLSPVRRIWSTWSAVNAY